MVELLMIRVVEVTLLPNIGYVVITCAMFGFGLAGTFAVVWPLRESSQLNKRLALLALVFAVSVFLVRPGMNTVPMVLDAVTNRGARYAISGSIIYFFLLSPFFLSGLILAYLFSAFPDKVRRLYFWDLCGAAVGCVVFLPFLERFGPGGLMFFAAAAAVLCAALYAGQSKYVAAAAPLVAALCIIPLVPDGYLDFTQLYDKRGLRTAYEQGRVEHTRWDLISKIDVVHDNADRKHVAYDGGSQSSTLFRFDGDLSALRQDLSVGDEKYGKHFWNRGVAASHFLRRDTHPKVLVIGSAAGQETKAALLFGAARVDGIELVGAVVDLVQGLYADFIGGIFLDPRVDVRVGEGRSFLRSSSELYDIIQIYSNHTSSNVARGIGATNPVYLQTVEAYQEYFARLDDDGILHVNHHFYPRMVTVAAKAWLELGRSHFDQHVMVFARPGWDTLPTMLIKMSPWSDDEVNDAVSFLSSGDDPSQLVVNPLDPETSFLSADFFDGGEASPVLRSLDYDVRPSTDDWPYFGNIQKHLRPVETDASRFLDATMAGSLNGRLEAPLGEYSALAAVAAAGVVFGLVLVLVPLWRSGAARETLFRHPATIVYFALLGAGFIIVELVLIQMFMRLIGFPLYTYAAVIFIMLFAAGLGSMAADRWNIHPESRWSIPFLCVLSYGLLVVAFCEPITNSLLPEALPVRLLASAALIFPLAFFMGMPFPLGILCLRNHPPGIVAWAWGTNGFFTVLGGVICGILSLSLGFKVTFLLGVLSYAAALVTLARMRRSATTEVA